MAVSFNGKIYNEEVFLRYLNEIPRTKFDAFLNSGALVVDDGLRDGLTEQTGGYYLTRHYRGRLDASNVQNYDGETDIADEATTTYEQAVIVIGRANAWNTQDFTYELTHVDFGDYVVRLLAEYRDDVDEADLIAICKGIAGVKGFENHIYSVDGEIGASTINTAIQGACGDRKDAFELFICHSAVATQLENLNLLEYWKYTDDKGITRNLALGTVNGKTCIIDDSCPYDANTDTYTSYVLGKGAFDYCDVGVKVPVETARDPKKLGGFDYLYYRWRKVLAPKGISFTKGSLKTKSPTAEELANADNWELIKGANDGETYPEKAIPICIIKSLGHTPDTSTDGGDVQPQSVKTTSVKAKAETTAD